MPELYGVWDAEARRWWALAEGVIWATPYEALANAQRAWLKEAGRNHAHKLLVCRFREDGMPILRERKAVDDDAG